MSKPISGTAAGLLGRSSASGTPLLMAECFSFSLLNGTNLYYTNSDMPVLLDGVLYVANSVLVEGLKYKADRTLGVDTQQITISYVATDTINGVSFSQAIVNGLFDGAVLTRKRGFMSAYNQPAAGGVVMFVGRVATVDEVGLTQAKLTVNSLLALLDIDMPRNLFSATCNWTLYGSGCSVAKSAFAFTGSCAFGSSPLKINWSGAQAAFAQGRLIFTSGTNSGLSVTVRATVPGVSLTLNRPMLETPAIGDTFTVYYGCDHTAGTCSGRFNNLANFRGYPYTPPPVMAV